MSINVTQSSSIQSLLNRVAGFDQRGGDERTKRILRKVVADLYATIEEFDVTPAEFWQALTFLQSAAPEFGLISPGLGFDHFQDVRLDAIDEKDGRQGGTPRTIEGPLYVAGAPLSDGWARLDDGTESGTPLIMHGNVRDSTNRPIAGAIVDVWQANTKGAYSHFDPTQTAFNNRRRIKTNSDGQYKFRAIVPSGYGVPPGGHTERLLAKVGRHGKRPAHIHFFISAPRFRHLTTQINIAGDPLLHDDFAYATRHGLIPPTLQRKDSESIKREGVDGAFLEIAFDFVLLEAASAGETEAGARPRAHVNS